MPQCGRTNRRPPRYGARELPGPGYDDTVVFGKLTLQLPGLRDRLHFARCSVLVHELLDDSLGVSFSGKLIARFNRQGAALPTLSGKAA